jgi:hypothetical protein
VVVCGEPNADCVNPSSQRHCSLVIPRSHSRPLLRLALPAGSCLSESNPGHRRMRRSGRLAEPPRCLEEKGVCRSSRGGLANQHLRARHLQWLVLGEGCCWALFPAHWDQAVSDEGERMAGNLEFVPASTVNSWISICLEPANSGPRCRSKGTSHSREVAGGDQRPRGSSFACWGTRLSRRSDGGPGRVSASKGDLYHMPIKVSISQDRCPGEDEVLQSWLNSRPRLSPEREVAGPRGLEGSKRVSAGGPEITEN